MKNIQLILKVFFTLALLFGSSSTFARSNCVHLGSIITCPSGVTSGSESIVDLGGGLLQFDDGNIGQLGTVGDCPIPASMLPDVLFIPPSGGPPTTPSQPGNSDQIFFFNDALINVPNEITVIDNKIVKTESANQPGLLGNHYFIRNGDTGTEISDIPEEDLSEKSRLEKLSEEKESGSHFIKDTRNIFLNPAAVNEYKNYVVTEWSKGSDENSDADEEGGFFREAGSFAYGVYLGDKPSNHIEPIDSNSNLEGDEDVYEQDLEEFFKSFETYKEKDPLDIHSVRDEVQGIIAPV